MGGAGVRAQEAPAVPGFGSEQDEGSGRVEEVLVEILRPPGDPEVWRGMARQILFLHEGDPFSEARLQESLDALNASAEFEEVRVERGGTADRVRLRFELVPARRIERIRIRGNQPLFESQVLEVMTFYPGNPFRPEALEEQERLVEELYRRQGFIEPRVTVRADRGSEEGLVVVTVTIERDRVLSLDRLVFHGRERFSQARLKTRMTAWWQSLLPGMPGRFEEEKLRRDARTLSRFYWKKRYPECRVEYEVHEDPGTGAVAVDVWIEEGPRYEVRVEEDMGFWEWTFVWRRRVNQNIVLSEAGNRNDSGLRRSVRGIRSRYKEAGYLDAAVRAETSHTLGEATVVRGVTFVIDPGPRSFVESIEIQGNEGVGEKQIRKQILTTERGCFRRGVFVPETLDEDILGVQALYLQEGYRDAEIREQLVFSDDRRRVAVRVDVEEGTRTEVASMEVTGTDLLSEKEVNKAVGLQAGTPFRSYMLQGDENALAGLIAERGYPHAVVKGEVRFDDDGRLAHVVYRVEPGPFVEMGEIYFAGYLKTRERFLRRLLEVETGEPFSLSRLLRGQREVRDLDVFRSVSFRTIGLKEQAPRVTLFVDVEETKPYYLQVGAGYATEKGVFGNAQLGDRNFLGRSINTWLQGEVSEIGYTGSLSASDPRFLGTRIASTYSVYGERIREFNQNFGTELVGARTGFERRLTRRLLAGVQFNLERRRLFDGQLGEGAGPEYYDARTVYGATPSLRLDTRDSRIRPRQGVYANLSVQVSKGLDDSLDDFLRYKLDVSFFLTPLNRLTLAWLGRAGFLDPYGPGGRVPEDQLFYLGGTQNVRGFRENMLAYDALGNPVGGRLSLTGGVEARVDLGYNLEAVAFFDAGRILQTDARPVADRIRCSAGPGLGYATPIGTLSLMYGFNLDRRPPESLGRLHFLIGYRF